MIEKYRVHEVAKDLGVASKEVVDLLAANFQGERKSMTALNEQELSVIFNHYTNQNQVESFDAVSYTHLDVYKRQLQSR